VRQLDERKRYWTEHFARWERSGLSQRRYCEQQRLSLSTFTLWRRRLATAPTKPCVDIVPIPVAHAARAVLLGSPSPLTVLLDGGRYRIEVGDGVSAELLRVVLDALESRQ
jgi:hypothetical protein